MTLPVRYFGPRMPVKPGLFEKLALALTTLVFSASLLATPQVMGYLLQCDWNEVCDQLPPLLEEEVQHEAVVQTEHAPMAVVGPSDESAILPRASNDSWHNALHGNVTVPPPEVR